MEHIIVLVGIAVGVGVGSSRIGDNSTLVHITTGLGIVQTHHIPRTDPYSFTAHGTGWVVQSWMPELLYGLLYKWAGAHALQVFNLVIYGVVGGLLTHLARTGNWLRTAVVAFVDIGIGASQWSPRPTAFGLLFLTLCVFVVVRKCSALWLIPIGFIWINSHGSWLLGIAYVATSLIGACIDRSADVRLLTRYFATLTLATVIGGLLSPANVRMLTFPLVPFGSRAHVFSTIVEWMSPNFRSNSFADGGLVLITLLIGLAVMFRSKPKWRDLLPSTVFIAVALMGLRNLPLLGVVLIPTLRTALTTVGQPASSHKRLHISAEAGLVGGVLAAVVCLVAAGAVWVNVRQSGLDLSSYPQAGVNWMQQQSLLGPGKHVYAPDWIGCYVIFQMHDQANVFIDDRYDMYPARVANDSLHLNYLDTNIQPILDRYEFDAVLLPRGARLAVYLSIRPDWTESWSDKQFEIFTPVRMGTL
jgi:hypothetical protein